MTPTVKVIDGRAMEPPEPFERVVEALADLGRDEQLLLILDREPFPLYRFLENNRYGYETTEHADGRFEILISRGNS